jgi:hypothetical protein
MKAEQKEFAVKTLKSFMQHMNDWENKYYDLMAQDAKKYADHAILELKTFYSLFVKNPDKKGRIHSPYPGNPPEYDPQKEPIDRVFADGQKVIIETHQEVGFKEKFRYTMETSGESWKISRKEVFDSLKEKWIKFLL